jgi:hypothetical protein
MFSVRFEVLKVCPSAPLAVLFTRSTVTGTFTLRPAEAEERMSRQVAANVAVALTRAAPSEVRIMRSSPLKRCAR